MRPQTKIWLCAGWGKTNTSDMDNPAQAIEDARRAGIDLSLLDSNLALTYEERVLRHASAQELMWALKEAGAAYEGTARPVAEVR